MGDAARWGPPKVLVDPAPASTGPSSPQDPTTATQDMHSSNDSLRPFIRIDTPEHRSTVQGGHVTPEVGAALIGACAVAISAMINLLTVQWVRKQENRSAADASAAQRAIAELAN